MRRPPLSLYPLLAIHSIRREGELSQNSSATLQNQQKRPSFLVALTTTRTTTQRPRSKRVNLCRFHSWRGCLSSLVVSTLFPPLLPQPIHSFSKLLEREACVSCGQREDPAESPETISYQSLLLLPIHSTQPTHILLSYLFVVKYIRPSSSTRLASTESSAPHSTLYCTLLNSLSQPAKLHGHIVAPCDD